ncbi:MAG: bifunctional NADH dehydrogenase FAD-containing subunit/selenide, water dikinase SelD, partial [Pseudomonadales bacterium]
MKTPDVKTKHLVLLGAGHAHLVFLKRLGMAPIAGLKVTLVNPDRCALYSGLLPGVIGGHFSADAMEINLGPLCQFAGADFVVGTAIHLDA